MQHIILFLQLIVNGGSVELPVYTKSRTMENYMYQTNLPALSSLTTCLWMFMGGETLKGHTVISIATPGQILGIYLNHNPCWVKSFWTCVWFSLVTFPFECSISVFASCMTSSQPQTSLLIISGWTRVFEFSSTNTFLMQVMQTSGS